ncbi:hypothetical protein HYV44_00520 [Candidatus Microgenomates bacterium]|nr:hypothetical protein [Candidatus Microgenomates bacterium]
MKLKSFLWTSEIITSFCWVVFFLILVAANPQKSSFAIFLLFFVVLFTAVIGTYGLLELRWVMKKRGVDMIRAKIKNAFRHGLMFAFASVGLLFMRGIDVLSAWDAIIFILAIILIEGYFLTKKPITTNYE